MIWTLALRQLKLYFRDKVSVFFSLLSVMIIIGLYVLFLGDIVSSGQGQDYRTMMDQWIMSGVIAVGGFTTTLGAFGILVDDKTKKIDRDFIVAPIKPTVRVLAYLLSALIIGTLMSLVTLVFAQIYILVYGGPLLTLLELVMVFALIILNVLTSSSIVFLLIIFIKTATTFSTVSTIVGTIIGFVMGIYVPIGNLPGAVQTVIKFFPTSHAAVMFRTVMMERSLDQVFLNAPDGERASVEALLGVRYFVNGQVMPLYAHILILAGTMIIFFSAAVLVLRYKKQK
ncbi:MAG: ABC transporter permease [Bacilli bacterium]|jgi:multidrug/hemolysin transport system permease protein